MKIYLASFAENRALVEVVSKYLKLKYPSIEITSTWHTEGPYDDYAEAVLTDFCDIDKSDMLLVLYPGHAGTSSEIGYALGKGKRICMLLPLLPVDNIFTEEDERYPEDMTLPMYHPDVIKYGDIDELLQKEMPRHLRPV